MSAPFATAFGNQRIISIPVSPQDYDRVTVTAVAAVNFGTQQPVSAASRAAQRVLIYLHWLTVTPLTFPAAFAGVVGNIQVQFLNNVPAVVFGPITLKQFAAASGNAVGSIQPYLFTPAGPEKLLLQGAGLATAVNAQFIANVTVIAGAPSFSVEIGYTTDGTNTGPTGSIGGQDIAAQGANNPNAF